jgi:hypothetical protein
MRWSRPQPREAPAASRTIIKLTGAGLKLAKESDMSDEELKKTLEAGRALAEEVTSSPEKALAFLVEMGLVTPDGRLTEPYRQDA